MSGGGSLDEVGGSEEESGGSDELVGGSDELVGGWLELVGGWLELGGSVVAAKAAVVLGTKLEAMPIMPPALTVSIAASASLEMFSILIGSLYAPRVGALW